MKKIFFAVFILPVLLLCAGCGTSIFDAGRLLSPPAMNKEDAGILSLFESGLEKGMQFIYPAEGENRSPIMRINLGADRGAGFLVFTRKTPDDKDITLSLVTGANNSYSVVSTFQLANTYSLESVSFIDFDGDGGAELTLISTDYENIKTASVHRITPGFLKEIFRERCQKAAVCNLSGDVPRLFLAKKTTDKKTVVTMFYGGENTQFKPVSISLRTGSDELLSIKAGFIFPEKPALIVECLDAGQTVTRLVLWQPGDAAPALTAAGADIPVRQNRRVCDDINGDGILEIPYEAADYYKTGAGQQPADSLRIYEWHQMKDTKQIAEQKFIRAENSRLRFAFTLPDTLANKTIIEQTGTGELAFYLRTDKEPSALFSIVSMERSAFNARVSLEKLSLLYEDGAMAHALSIPKTLSDEARALLPTIEQFKKAFEPYINTEVSLK